jgi:hypothetical protein
MLPYPKLLVLLADEICFDKGALGVLATHAKAVKERAQKEPSMTRIQKKCTPWRREKMSDQPSPRP